jgi:hypothetical protein
MRTNPQQVLSFNANAFAIDAVRGNPAVDASAIVPNLKTVALTGFNQMDVMETVYLAQDDISNLKLVEIDRRHRAQLAGLNSSFHRVSARAELHGFALLEFFDVGRCPAHAPMKAALTISIKPSSAQTAADFLHITKCGERMEP